MRRTLGAVFLLILMTGCGPIKSIIKPDFTLRGEVFVVTNGAQNIRLGRLAIQVYEPATIENHLNLRKTAYEKLLRDLNQEMLTLVEAGPQLIKESEDARALADRRRGTWDQEKTENAAQYVEQKLKDVGLRLNALQKQYDELLTGRFFFDALPSPSNSAITDSEGKYQIKLRKNKPYVVVATSQYNDAVLFWIVNVPATTEDGIDLTLSNDNRVKISHGKPVFQ